MSELSRLKADRKAWNREIGATARQLDDAQRVVEEKTKQLDAQQAHLNEVNRRIKRAERDRDRADGVFFVPTSPTGTVGHVEGNGDCPWHKGERFYRQEGTTRMTYLVTSTLERLGQHHRGPDWEVDYVLEAITTGIDLPGPYLGLLMRVKVPGVGQQEGLYVVSAVVDNTYELRWVGR